MHDHFAYNVKLILMHFYRLATWQHRHAINLMPVYVNVPITLPPVFRKRLSFLLSCGGITAKG